MKKTLLLSMLMSSMLVSVSALAERVEVFRWQSSRPHLPR
jgi:hypothetical protein